jgi:hypothetical protein
MKRILAIALLALVGCASNKPKNYDRECEAFFVRIKDYQDNYLELFKTKLFGSFEARYEISTKMPFPIYLEDGRIVNCREKITCDGTDYCIILEIDGEWGGFLL